MKRKIDCLIEALLEGNNSFDIERDRKITEDVLRAMEIYAISNSKIPNVREEKIIIHR